MPPPSKSSLLVEVGGLHQDAIEPAEPGHKATVIRVLAAHGFRFAHLNPYNAQLYGELVRLGVRVYEFGWFRPLRGRFDIVHLHWPEFYIGQKNPLKAAVGSLALLLTCAWHRSRGAKIVWTVHNTRSHQHSHPLAEQLFWALFTRLLDAYICLSKSGRRDIQKLRPALRHIHSYVIPHGHYREAYPNDMDRGGARRDLGLNEGTKVLLFLGNILPYKNVVELAHSFHQVPDPDFRLLIAGRCLLPDLKHSLLEIAKRDPRIQLYMDFVSRERIQVFLRAADLMVLPFRNILNSGSALLALSFDCPVLVPERGAMPELQQEMGVEWVRMFSGDLEATELQRALEWAILDPRAASPPMEHLNWQNVAIGTLRAFEALSAAGHCSTRTEKLVGRPEL